jgi:hypothetical protein
MMTRSEALGSLKSLVPDHDICLAISVWHFTHHTDGEVEYRVSILPGLDNTPCSQYTGKSIESVVSIVSLAAALFFDNKASTVLDEQFA